MCQFDANKYERVKAESLPGKGKQSAKQTNEYEYVKVESLPGKGTKLAKNATKVCLLLYHETKLLLLNLLPICMFYTKSITNAY